MKQIAAFGALIVFLLGLSACAVPEHEIDGVHYGNQFQHGGRDGGGGGGRRS